MDDPIPVDNPDDEIIPASPGARKASTMFGCLFVLVFLVALTWFILTHLESGQGSGWLGP